MDEPGDAPSGPPPVRYDGTKLLPDIRTRAEFVRAGGTAATEELATTLARSDDVYFMPTDVEETIRFSAGGRHACLNLFGCLPDGSKAHVRVDKLPVFFDVKVPDDTTTAMFKGSLYEQLGSVNPTRIDVFQSKPLVGFREGESDYCRIHFRNLQDRKSGLRLIRTSVSGQADYETGSDDMSGHYRKVARNLGLPLTSWIRVSLYGYSPGGAHPNPPSRPVDDSPLAEHVLDADAANLTAVNEDEIMQNPLLSHDRTLVMTFDIETYTPNRSDIATPERDTDIIFMLCATAHWKDSRERLGAACLVAAECEPDERWQTYICRTQEDLIRAFSLLVRAWAPDVITGFNDGRFDWPFIVGKASRAGMLAEMYENMSAIRRRRIVEEDVEKWNYVEDKRVKISADKTTYVSFFKVPGYVVLDTRVVYMQLYPKAEKTSLNYFLKQSRLDSKADMPYTRMFRIYEERDAAQMREVAHYCVIDSQRCQDLLVTRRVISDKREVGSISFTSLADCIHLAGGHKVCNLLFARAERRGLVCSALRRVPSRGGKYPGAYVVPPRKGLVKRPLTGLDFSSLYPSLIMAYNLSPEMFVETASEAARLRRKGYDLHHVDFDYSGERVEGWFVRHNNDDSMFAIFPRVLRNLFMTRKNMKKDLKIFEAQIEHMELVLAEFERLEPDERPPFHEHVARMWAGLAPADCDKMFKYDVKAMMEAGATVSEAAYRACLEVIEFKFMAVDSKQKAVKVFMNTFYGEAGNSLSPLFLLELAGGVTAAGRYNIMMVKDYVELLDYIVIYGDTDSLYITLRDEAFEEAFAAYEAGGRTPEDYERYCAAQVMISMAEMGRLRDKVNAHLAGDNGTAYLKMAYEEVLFPALVCGKKKYLGIPHIHTPNFRPNKLFVRGIDIVKQGQTPLAKEIANRIMWSMMELRRPEDPQPTALEITEGTLTDAIERSDQWVFDDFIQSDAWKPDKQNMSVQKFMARMRPRHAAERTENDQLAAAGMPTKKMYYAEPEPGDRFRYVVVKRGAEFDLRGRKVDNSAKGAKMEYVDVAKDFGHELDVPYYLIHYVVGICARFVNHDQRFEVHGPDTADATANDEAVKYLKRFVKGLLHEDKAVALKRGYAYKRAYKRAAAEVARRLRDDSGDSARVFGGVIDTAELFLEGDPVEDMMQRARAAAAEAGHDTDIAALLGANGIHASGRDLGADGRPLRTHNNVRRLAQELEGRRPRRGGPDVGAIRRARLTYLNEEIGRVRRDLGPLMERIAGPRQRLRGMLEYYVGRERQEEHRTHGEVLGGADYDNYIAAGPAPILELTAEEESSLGSVLDLWTRMLGLWSCLDGDEAARVRVAELRVQCRDRVSRTPTSPSRERLREIIEHSAAAIAE